MLNEVNVLLDTVQEAGKTILNLQKTDFSITTKDNGDLLTKADLAANDILKTRLLQAFPEDGWLSEESVDDESRLTAKRVWIVDPIDGTKEFVEGLPEYAISVALVERGEPILSAIYNPAMNELFHAIKNQGAWLNQKKINCRTQNDVNLLFLASRSEFKRGEWDRYAAKYEVKQVGSIAYKLALVAAGQAQITFSLGPKNEWDIAAGALIVAEAGGVVANKAKEKLVFNRKDVKVNGIVAAAFNNIDHAFSFIA